MSFALLGTGPGVLKASGSLGRLQVHTQLSCLFFFFFLKLTKTQTDCGGSWKAESCSGLEQLRVLGFRYGTGQAAWGPGQGRQYPVALISRLHTAGGGGGTHRDWLSCWHCTNCTISHHSELHGTRTSFLETPGATLIYTLIA